MAIQIKDDLEQKQPLALADALEGRTITIFETELLANYTGSGLSIKELTADRGSVGSKNEGSWSFKPDEDYNGAVILTYVVTNGTESINSSTSFQIKPINDPPKETGSEFTFPALTNDSTLTFTSAQLLQGFTDIDGDTLSLSGLKVKEDKGFLSQIESNWTYTPEKTRPKQSHLNI